MKTIIILKILATIEVPTDRNEDKNEMRYSTREIVENMVKTAFPQARIMSLTSTDKKEPVKSTLQNPLALLNSTILENITSNMENTRVPF